MGLTEQQARAAWASGSVAITAGAGTGKTFVLAERYLYFLRDRGFSPLEVVAATFTDKAAQELKSRIRSFVRSQHPEQFQWLAELEAAPICTLHSLAKRICEEHPQAANVPVSFTMMDELEAPLWQAEKLSEALAQLPADIYDHLPYSQLKTILGQLLTDPLSVEAAFTKISTDLQADWENLADRLIEQERQALVNHPVWQNSFYDLTNTCSFKADKIEEERLVAVTAMQVIESKPQKQQLQKQITALKNINLKGGSKKSWHPGDLERVKEAIKAVRDLTKNHHKNQSFSLEFSEIDQTLAVQLPIIRRAFQQVYQFIQAAKHRQRILNFDDLEVGAITALKQPEVQQYYRDRFKVFLVDEFQDTNPIQAKIVNALTGLTTSQDPRNQINQQYQKVEKQTNQLSNQTLNKSSSKQVEEQADKYVEKSENLHTLFPENLPPANLTIVGDVKQSIYRFRRADVQVFLNFSQQIQAQGGDRVEMSLCFRTHDRLIQKINQIFRPLLGEIHQDLEASRLDAPDKSPPIEFYAIESEGTNQDGVEARRRAEGRNIAQWIQRAIAQKWPVVDRSTGQTRPMQYGDVAILARSWNVLKLYGDMLEACGVPMAMIGGDSLLATQEGLDVLALLRWLLDDRDDLALITLLRSPFFAVSDRTLAQIVEQTEPEHPTPLPSPQPSPQPSPRLSWWERLQAFDGIFDGTFDEIFDGTSSFDQDDPVTILRSLRQASRQNLPSRLIQLADQRTGYSATIGNLPSAARRLADWRGLLELVRSLERDDHSLFTVVRRLERAIEGEVKIPRPALEADNAVSLLTIHKSKGLEWPVVFVADLNRKETTSKDKVRFDPEWGMAFTWDDETSGKKQTPILFRWLEAQEKVANEAEVLRLLYVALTRARDRLILTANEPKNGGVDLLRPGLEAADIPMQMWEFNADDPTIEPLPLPTATHTNINYCLEPIAWQPHTLPITAIRDYAQCPQRFLWRYRDRHPGRDPQARQDDRLLKIVRRLLNLLQQNSKNQAQNQLQDFSPDDRVTGLPNLVSELCADLDFFNSVPLDQLLDLSKVTEDLTSSLTRDLTGALGVSPRLHDRAIALLERWQKLQKRAEFRTLSAASIIGTSAATVVTHLEGLTLWGTVDFLGEDWLGVLSLEAQANQIEPLESPEQINQPVTKQPVTKQPVTNQWVKRADLWVYAQAIADRSVQAVRSVNLVTGKVETIGFTELGELEAIARHAVTGIIDRRFAATPSLASCAVCPYAAVCGEAHLD